MIINGVYEKTLYRDEKMGDTTFTVIPRLEREFLGEYGNIVCKGVIPRYPAKVPLKLVLSKNSDGSYSVWNTFLDAFSKESTIDFLVSGFVSGIGPVKAEKFVEDYGYDIFTDKYEKEYPSVFEKVKGLMVFEKLLRLMEDNGGSFHNAYRIYKRFGAHSLEELYNNPYSVRDIIPFGILDSFAMNVQIDRFDERRIRCILKNGIKAVESSGNTCSGFEDFVKIISRSDEDIDPFIALGEVLADKDFYVSENKYIYDSQLYLSEENIAFNVARLESQKMDFGKIDENIIKEIEEETGNTYDDQQREAFKLLENSGVKAITGGPGTGKTTVINGLIMYIHKLFPSKTISLAAPTANAAKRMREKTGENATTIHKLLEIQPFADSDSFGFKNIDDDFLIIDESSFIDTRLASIIFQSVKKGATVIMVGDVDQLPSVGAGNVFKDFIDSGCIPVIRLEKIFRQSDGSSIIENAVFIKNGITNLITDISFVINRFNDEQTLFDTAIGLMQKYYNKEEPYSVRLYTPVRKRKYLSCTHNINKALQEYFSDKGECFIYGYTRFYVGDPVIFTHNNYSSGYCNGDEGKITRILSNDDGKYGVEVSISESLIEITGDDLLDMELSFAITTHKSQGSECDIAIVIVPQNPSGMLDRSIVYVASTRARKRTIILTEGNALERAIKNDRKKNRKTGLKRMFLTKIPQLSP